MTTKNIKFLYGGCCWHLPSFFVSITQIVRKATCIDLATDPTFSQSFIENMMFE